MRVARCPPFPWGYPVSKPGFGVFGLRDLRIRVGGGDSPGWGAGFGALALLALILWSGSILAEGGG